MFRHPVFLVLIIFVGLQCFFPINSEVISGPKNKHKIVYRPVDQTHLKDTLFTLKNSFLEVNLNKQVAYLHMRDGELFKFRISTGTDRLTKGINTNPGLYVVQSKVELCKSKQFDETELLFWVGFNKGIGFHALKTSGYYNHLGRRPSSHGCIRVSREDAKHVYYDVTIGTPVLVHNEDNALYIGFANKGEDLYSPKKLEIRRLVQERLNELYTGSYLINLHKKIAIDTSNVTHDGLTIGNSALIARTQLSMPIYKYVGSSTPDVLSYVNITKDTLNSNGNKAALSDVKKHKENSPVIKNIKTQKKSVIKNKNKKKSIPVDLQKNKFQKNS